MNKLLLCVLLILAGCQTLPQGKASIPESMVQECPQLYKLEGTTGEDLLSNITKNAALYYSCRDGKKALIDAVRIK